MMIPPPSSVSIKLASIILILKNIEVQCCFALKPWLPKGGSRNPLLLKGDVMRPMPTQGVRSSCEPSDPTGQCQPGALAAGHAQLTKGEERDQHSSIKVKKYMLTVEKDVKNV